MGGGTIHGEVDVPKSIYLQHAFYGRPAVQVAHDIIGRRLIRQTNEGAVGGVIVETEAYTEDDPASHSFCGLTPRNRAMFGPPGHAYVYRIYGVHWCLNAVAQPPGTGEAVLIRAIRPTIGMDFMRRNRGIDQDLRLCRGPGSLCAALGITGVLNGIELTGPDLMITEDRERDLTVLAVPRIGISKAMDRPWRFLAAGSAYVSGPRRLISRGSP